MAATFTIKLADLVIGISTLHDGTHALCRGYLIDGAGQPDISIAIDQAAIDYEHDTSDIMEYIYAAGADFGLRIFQQFPEQ